MLMTSLLALSAAAAVPEDGGLGDRQPVEAVAPPVESQPVQTQPDATVAVAVPVAVADKVDDPAGAAEAVDDAILLRDPWTKPNHVIFKVDMFFDQHLLGPTARGYSAVVPEVVRFHISNAILNLDEPSTVLNTLLQLKFGRAVKSSLRFVINSTLGIAGLFDVAEAGGLPRRVADFGQTLGRYGVKPGPYAMLPVLGPSNVRDGFGRLVDTFTDPMGFVIGGVFTSFAGAGRYVAEGVNWRQQNDGVMKAVRGASDPYAFVRSAYSQQRAAVVQDATGKAAALPDF